MPVSLHLGFDIFLYVGQLFLMTFLHKLVLSVESSYMGGTQCRTSLVCEDSTESQVSLEPPQVSLLFEKVTPWSVSMGLISNPPITVLRPWARVVFAQGFAMYTLCTSHCRSQVGTGSLFAVWHCLVLYGTVGY